MEKELMTKSDKPAHQVLEEARKFCEMNESPKTFEKIKFILTGDVNEKHCVEVVSFASNKTINQDGEEGVPRYVSDEVWDIAIQRK